MLTVQVVGAQNEPLAGAMVGLLGIVNPEGNSYTVPLAPESWRETDSKGKVSFYASADDADE